MGAPAAAHRGAAAVRRSDPSPNLDVLRSLAVIFVVVSHVLLDKSQILIGCYHVQTLGTLGVLIFFVHTCLVLMRSLERQVDRYGHRWLAFSFLLARAFRIYPLSIVVVLALATLGRMHSHGDPALAVILSNLFLVQNLTDAPSVTPVLWSLPFEVQMYLFLPALYWWTRPETGPAGRRVVVLWCALIGLVFVFWELRMRADLIKFFPCFLPGVLAYCMDNTPRRWPPQVLFSYVALAALAYPAMVGLGASATVLSWFICLILGALIPRCAEVGAPWLRLCGAVVARYSYGIYLVHISVLKFAFHYLTGMSPILSWSIFFIGIALLPYCMYHLVEKPGIECGRLLVERMHMARVRTAQNI